MYSLVGICLTFLISRSKMTNSKVKNSCHVNEWISGMVLAIFIPFSYNCFFPPSCIIFNTLFEFFFNICSLFQFTIYLFY